jgi:hypothetical protein
LGLVVKNGRIVDGDARAMEHIWGRENTKTFLAMYVLHFTHTKR